jgi:4-hydroxyphenylacetate 3-monooxygenase
MVVRNGEQFLKGLQDGREVWLEGERVADVTAHPKLARMARTLASLYDLQHAPQLHEQMTFKSPTSGEPVALSYIVPQSQEDLLRRRRALEITARAHHGMLGRTPDYVNMAVTATRQFARIYGERDKRFTENAIAYHEYVRERDLCITHTFGHPQVNRGVGVGELPDPYVALGIVEATGDGVIVKGCRLLATLAPFSDELFAPAYRPLRLNAGEEMYCIGFAIPVNTRGLKFICRESYDLGRSLYDYPLSGQFDEMDCLAVFDDVLIPWERVFTFQDIELNNRNLQRAPTWRQFVQQVAVKNIAKVEFILGLVHEIAEAIGITGFSHVQEKIAEVIDTLETLRAYLRASEADAGPIEGAEGLWPAAEPLAAMRIWFTEAYPRVIWIVEQLSASGLMLTPTEADVSGPLADAIARYYQGATLNAADRIRLFRLAWDLVGTQFGSRQALYERFSIGDIVRLRQTRYATYDYTRAKEAVRSFFERCT